MPDVSITYKDAEIASLSASGTKTLETAGTYCEDDITVEYIQPSGGGGITPAPSKDVNFYDYDGTILHSYTAADFADLSALPSNPTHEGLTAQGWNWTLSDAKTYVASYGKLNIGQMYITDDGATRLYIHIAETGRMTVPLYFSQTVANGVTINWGDGSTAETMSGTGYINTAHTYSAVGDYTITLLPAANCTLGLGNGSNSTAIFGGGNNGRVYQNMLRRAEIGKNVSVIDNYAFYYFYSLSIVTIPSSVTSIGGSTFRNCYSLTSITVPSGVTVVGSSAFQNDSALSSASLPSGVTGITNYLFNTCYSLSDIKIPDTVTSIGENAFQNCHALSRVVIPSSVTTIAAGAFQNCYGVKEYHLKRTTPPTLSNANAFQNIPSDCIIYVPSGKLTDYQGASNWSNYSSYMRGE